MIVNLWPPRLFLSSVAVIFCALLLSSPALASEHQSDYPSASPAGLKNNTTRTVMQIIDNQFYKWHEYENPVDNSTTIYLVEPEQKMLSTAQADALLKASKQWEKQNFTYQGIPRNNDPYESIYQSTGHDLKPAPGKEILVRENLHISNGMTDLRTAVQGSEALSFPYNTIGFLTIDFPSEYMRGTGFIVSPHTVLTNAHNIYSPLFGGSYESIQFSLAQHETENFEVIKPFGSASPDKAEVTDTFLQFEDSEDRDQAINYDYGALFFEQPISAVSTFMPLQFNYSPEEVSLAGYPGLVQGSSTLGLWKSYGTLLRTDRHCLYYNAYTSGGNSGSPVFYYESNAETYRVVAIHSFASANFFSGGPHFNNINRDTIEKWVRWEPEAKPGPLSLDITELILDVGDQKVLTLTITPRNGEINEIVWISNHPAIATVNSSGLVTAVGSGKTTVRALTPDGREEARCEVMVFENSDRQTEDLFPEEMYHGDINGNNRIDVQDVVLASQYVLQLADLNAEQVDRADVNRDGTVNVIDVTLIMQYATGLIDSF